MVILPHDWSSQPALLYEIVDSLKDTKDANDRFKAGKVTKITEGIIEAINNMEQSSNSELTMENLNYAKLSKV